MWQNRGWIDALLMILFLHIILNMVQNTDRCIFDRNVNVEETKKKHLP